MSVLSSCDGLLDVPVGHVVCSSDLAVPVHVGMGTGQIIHADSMLVVWSLEEEPTVTPCVQDNATCIERCTVPVQQYMAAAAAGQAKSSLVL